MSNEYQIIKERFETFIEGEALLDKPKKKKINLKLKDPYEDPIEDTEIEDADIEEMNINHGGDGQFSSSKGAKCKSSYFVDGKRKRVSGALTDKDEAGRGRSKDGHGRFVCKSNELLWEEDLIKDMHMSPDNLKELIRSELIEVLSDYDEYLNNEPVEEDRNQLAAQCKRLGMTSFKDFLRAYNNIQKASKGELLGKD